MAEAEKKPLPEGIAYVDDLIAKHYMKLPEGSFVPTNLKGDEFVCDVLAGMAEKCVDENEGDRYKWLAADMENVKWFAEIIKPEYIDNDDLDIDDIDLYLPHAVGRAQKAKAENMLAGSAYADFCSVVCLDWLRNKGIAAIDESSFDESVERAAKRQATRIKQITSYSWELLEGLEEGKHLTRQQIDVISGQAYSQCPVASIPQKSERACDPKSAEHEARSQASQAAGVQDRPKKQSR